MTWEDILKQGELNAEGWPNEVIAFYKPKELNIQKKWAIPRKERIDWFRGKEEYMEVKLTFMYEGEQEDTAEYSYDSASVHPSKYYMDTGGEMVIQKWRAIQNALGKDYNWKTGKKFESFKPMFQQED